MLVFALLDIDPAHLHDAATIRLKPHRGWLFRRNAQTGCRLRQPALKHLWIIAITGSPTLRVAAVAAIADRCAFKTV